MTSFLLITLAASFLLQKLISPVGDAAVAFFNSSETTYTGVVTDARCGGDMLKGLDSLSVQRCLPSGGGVKYALYDGHTLFVLGDQRAPERFVGRRVRIRGTLRQDSNVLEVRAIDPI